MKNESSLLTYECVNCGFKAWSLRRICKCSKCGATVVCTTPTVNDSNNICGAGVLKK